MKSIIKYNEVKIYVSTILLGGILRFSNFFRKKKLLLIIGCGRSGTKFTGKLFRELGIKIGHEKLMRDGISSWYLVPDSDKKMWGYSWNDLKNFDKMIIHQVRHPLKVISSSQTFDSETWEFISKFIPINKNDSLVLKSMKYWYYWNLMAEKKAKYTFRVEKIDKELDNIIKLFGFKIKSNKEEILKKIPKNVNTRKHHNLTWKELEKEDKVLSLRIKKLAKRYKYKI